MECSDPRQSDEERVIAALDKMDDKSVTLMRRLMEKVAIKHPRPPRANLTIVKNTQED
jgi:hypothetical protein